MIPHEREVTLEQARDRIHGALASLDLGWRARQFGRALHATVAEIFDDTGKHIATGTGKGRSEAALVGSLFEAYEHWLSLHHPSSLDQELLGVGAVAGGLGNPIDAILTTQPGARLACRRYASLVDGQTTHYPLALAHPLYPGSPVEGDSFDYTALARYASNNGTASGATLEEATLHALHECIERDDIATFLRRQFFEDRDDPLVILRRDADLPCVQAVWADAEDELASRITLLDVTTHAAARTFMAFALVEGRPQHLYGAGCSSSTSHAACRALAELVQVHTVANVVPSVGEELAREEQRVRRWPRLHRSCVADLPGLCTRRRLAWSQGMPECPAGAVATGVDQCVRSLVSEGFHPVRHVFPAMKESRVSACQVLVPGFDRFYLASRGAIVVPRSSRETPHASA